MSLVISASQTTQRSHLLTLKKCPPLGIIMSTYKRTISVVTTFPFHHSNNCFCFSTFSNSCVHVTYFFVQNRQMSVIHQHYSIAFTHYPGPPGQKLHSEKNEFALHHCVAAESTKSSQLGSRPRN